MTGRRESRSGEVLHIHCTAKLAKAARLEHAPTPAPDGLSWVDSWYGNLIDFSNDERAVLFTNPTSLFSLVVPVRFGPLKFFPVVEQFRTKLRDALRFHGAEPNQIELLSEHQIQYATHKTASRSVLGSMNDMALSIHAVTNWESLDGKSPSIRGRKWVPTHEVLLATSRK